MLIAFIKSSIIRRQECVSPISARPWGGILKSSEGSATRQGGEGDVRPMMASHADVSRYGQNKRGTAGSPTIPLATCTLRLLCGWFFLRHVAFFLRRFVRLGSGGFGFGLDRAGDHLAILLGVGNLNHVAYLELFQRGFSALGIGGKLDLFVLFLNRERARLRIQRCDLTSYPIGLRLLGFHLCFLLCCRSGWSRWRSWSGRFRLREAESAET